MSKQNYRMRFTLRWLLIGVALLAAALGGGLAWWRRTIPVERLVVRSTWDHELMVLAERMVKEMNERRKNGELRVISLAPPRRNWRRSK